MKIISGIISQFFLAGTLLLLIFTVLSGSTNHSPINKFYWLRADTSGIPGAYQTSVWSFWGVCDNDDKSSCTYAPAAPISPVDNFHTKTNVPHDFVANRSNYFYLSRFGFAFTIIALASTAFAFILGFVAIANNVIVFFISFGLFFLAGAVAFQTSVVVLARNAFQDENLSVHVSTKLMAIIWTSFVTLLIVFINAFSTNIISSYKDHMANVRSQDTVANPAVGPAGDESSFTRTPAEPKDENTGGIRFFKIKRNNKVPDEESV